MDHVARSSGGLQVLEFMFSHLKSLMGMVAYLIIVLVLSLLHLTLNVTRWTFFRVKLVFEFEFEISWSLGPWDLGTTGPWDSWTLGPLDLGTLGPLPSSTTSSYFLLPPPLSSSYSPPLVWFWFGLVWYGGVLSCDL